MLSLKKLGTLAVATLVLAGVTVGAVGQASAEDGRNAALLGGLAAGAILGGAIVNGGYHHPYGAYADEDYVAPVMVRHCYRERRAVYDEWGDFAGYRLVRVCN